MVQFLAGAVAVCVVSFAMLAILMWRAPVIDQ